MKKLSTRYGNFTDNTKIEDEKAEDQESTQCSNSISYGQTFNKDGFNFCQILGNIGNAFIICYYEGKIYLVDQHAASEKSLYVRFLKEKNLLPESYQGQPFDVENIYMEVLQEEQETLKSLGWTYQIIKHGPVFATVRLTSSPSIFDKKCRQQEFQQILQSYFQKSLQELSKNQKQYMATVACHNAYKVGDKLDNNDMRSLIDTLYQMDGAFNCPHGRPIITCLGPAEKFIAGIQNTRKYTLL